MYLDFRSQSLLVCFPRKINIINFKVIYICVKKMVATARKSAQIWNMEKGGRISAP